jgi:ABC-type proline/glycine betaine transport system substrate-binding protein
LQYSLAPGKQPTLAWAYHPHWLTIRIEKSLGTKQKGHLIKVALQYSLAPGKQTTLAWAYDPHWLMINIENNFRHKTKKPPD